MQQQRHFKTFPAELPDLMQVLTTPVLLQKHTPVAAWCQLAVLLATTILETLQAPTQHAFLQRAMQPKCTLVAPKQAGKQQRSHNLQELVRKFADWNRGHIPRLWAAAQKHSEELEN